MIEKLKEFYRLLVLKYCIEIGKEIWRQRGYTFKK